MWIRRIRIGLAAGIAALAFGVPLAGAGNTLVDDYWRDQAAATTRTANSIVDDYWRYEKRSASPTPDTIVDDYFRDNATVTVHTPNTIVDDYFRDAPPAAVNSGNGGFDWADFGIGAAAAVGAMLVLAGLGFGVLVLRQDRSGRAHPSGTA